MSTERQRRRMVRITVQGPVGSGKSALIGEIEITLRALGIPVFFEDAKGWESEKNMTHADWVDELERTKPMVTLVEQQTVREDSNER